MARGLIRLSLLPEDFSVTESGCLLGKAGRSHFYSEWEALAERLRRELDKSVHDITEVIGSLRQNVPLDAPDDFVP